MRKMNVVMMTVAGLLLMVAAVLKTHEVMKTPVPSWDAKAQAHIDDAAKKGEVMPVWKANALGFFESYEFFLIQIPVEFALGAWMVCGLFRKAAWLAGTLCYFMFIFITLAKLLLGYKSCGCFGLIEVEPWKTLAFIDIPFFLLLAIFRPKGHKLLPPPWPNVGHAIVCAVPILAVLVLAAPMVVTFRPEFKEPEQMVDEGATERLWQNRYKKGLSKKQQEIDSLNKIVEELRKTPRTTDKKAFVGVLEVIAADTPNVYEIQIGGKQTLLINADNLEDIYLSIKDAEKQTIAITETGQVQMHWVEPKPAPGPKSDPNEIAPEPIEKWEWLEFVVEDEVREQISEGLAIVVMHRHDCSICVEMAPKYSEYYAEMLEQGNDAFKIAFLAVPPYHEKEDTVPDDTPCILGKLTDKEKWGLMSPYVVALLEGELMKTWKEGTAPDPDKILDEVFGQ